MTDFVRDARGRYWRRGLVSFYDYTDGGQMVTAYIASPEEDETVIHKVRFLAEDFEEGLRGPREEIRMEVRAKKRAEADKEGAK